MASLPVPSAGDSSPVRNCPECNRTISERWKSPNCPRCTAKTAQGTGNYRYVPLWQLAGELGVSVNVIKKAVSDGVLHGKQRRIDGQLTDVVKRAPSYPFKSNKGAANKTLNVVSQYPIELEPVNIHKSYTKLDESVMLYTLREALTALELLVDYIVEKGK